MDRDYMRITSADPDDPEPKTLLNLKTSWCVGKVVNTWDYDWRALYRLANGEWLILFETEFSGALYLRVTAREAADWCVSESISVPPELEGELEPDCIGVPSSESTDPPRPGDWVELPNGDVGIVEALPNYPDEMLVELASKWQAFVDAPAQAATDQAEPPATKAQPTEAMASEAATVQTAAVEPAPSSVATAVAKPQSTTAQQAADDGPVPPRSFILGDKQVDDLPPLRYKLLAYLWQQDKHLATKRNVSMALYGDEEAQSTRLPSLMSRTNERLSANGVPATVEPIGDYVRLLIDRP